MHAYTIFQNRQVEKTFVVNLNIWIIYLSGGHWPILEMDFHASAQPTSANYAKQENVPNRDPSQGTRQLLREPRA